MIVLLLALAFAQPAPEEPSPLLPLLGRPASLEVLPAAMRATWEDAERHEALDDWAGAEKRYFAVWTNTDPQLVQALVRAAEMERRQGQVNAAADTLRMAEFDPDALEALGRLYYADQRYGDAAWAFERLVSIRTDWPGAQVLWAKALAGADPVKGAAVLEAYLINPGAAYDADLEIAVRETARALRALDTDPDREAARVLIEDAEARFPEIAAAEGWEELVLEGEIDVLAIQLASSDPQDLDGEERAQLTEARGAFARGDVGRAKTILRALATDKPRNPEVFLALADVHQAVGDVTAAEEALLWAEVLAPLDPRPSGRRGDLLVRYYGGRRNAEAVEAYERALLLDPSDADTWRRKGDAERGAVPPEALDAAVFAYEKAAALDPDDTDSVRALTIANDTRRVPPPPPTRSAAPSAPEGIPEPAWRLYWVALAWHLKGHPDPAMAALDQALELHPGWTSPLNLKAQILLDRDPAAAEAALQASLQASPGQPAVVAQLGEIAERRGDHARAMELWSEAAGLGSADAHLVLAREAWEADEAEIARAHLDLYFAGTTSGDHYDEALALRQSLEARDQNRKALVAGGVVAVVAIPTIFVLRRRSGSALSVLLDRAPESYRDVARIVSALRHEVLKHATGVLPLVADALDAGDPEPAKWAAEQLFGDRGAVERFREHIRDLETLGRAHGVTLNLRWRDPTFGPLIAGVDRLVRLRRSLYRGSGMRLSTELRAISETLNDFGTKALARLIRSLAVLELDEERVRAAWARVGDDRLELVVDLPAEPLHLRIWQAELEDILHNLIRNAVQASIEAGSHRIGVRAEIEEDDVTGLERIAIRVADDAPRRITTAMIRSRYIERGLGLTVDLISRNGGSIGVEDEDGWSKAVVVRLARAELVEEG